MSPLSNEPMTELTKPQPIKEIDILWITAGLGTLGDHGTMIMIARGELDLETDIESDCAPLHSLVADMQGEAKSLDALDHLHCLRYPTRGGLAT